MLIPQPLSILATQLRGNRALFGELHKHPWLVWEPNPEWKSPVGEELTAGAGVSIAALRTDSTAALAYALPAQAGVSVLSVGRDTARAIILNESTVSRNHFRLRMVSDGWTIERVEGADRLVVGGLELGAGQVTLLHSGDQLLAGSAKLTFLDAAALVTRLGSRP